MTDFIGGVIVGLLLAILDSVRHKVPTPKEVWRKVYPETGEVITTHEPLVEAIQEQ